MLDSNSLLSNLKSVTGERTVDIFVYIKVWGVTHLNM